MGIPYYFRQIYTKYSKNQLLVCQDKIKNTLFNSVFFDYNSLIHPCAKRVMDKIENVTDSNVIEECIAYTKHILEGLSYENLYIVIDGVAPYAKIKQQRERRLKTQMLGNLKWDTNKITPGTKFMKKLSLKLKSIFPNVSDSEEIGEAEHKIMSIITNSTRNGKICIYGLDCDLMMLSLLNVKHENIYLYRESLKQGEMPSLLEIATLKKSILNEMETKGCIVLSEANLIEDYVLLCFLLGNDFLPSLPNIDIKYRGIDILMNAYSKCKNGLIKNGYINFSSLHSIFRYLSNGEIRAMSLKKEIECKEQIPTVDKWIFNTIDFIKYSDPGYKRRYYHYYDITNIEEMCSKYVEGMQWVYDYYKGNITDWLWVYEYNTSPFASDLCSYRYKKNKKIKTYPLTTQEQLLNVLPPQSLYAECNVKGREIKEVYVDMIHKEYLHQGRIISIKYI